MDGISEVAILFGTSLFLGGLLVQTSVELIKTLSEEEEVMNRKSQRRHFNSS